MKSIEMTARSVEEARRLALKELRAGSEDVEVTILEEGSKGLFGLLGSRDARVRVTLLDNPCRRALSFLAEVSGAMELNVETNARLEGEFLHVECSGEEVGALIGRRGGTLNALQYLLGIVVNRDREKKVRVILDVEGYRQRRQAALEGLARRMAEKVKRTGTNIALEPMAPQERRIIHTALQQEKDVYTFSQGEEPYRKVIIASKKGQGVRQRSRGFGQPDLEAEEVTADKH